MQALYVSVLSGPYQFSADLSNSMAQRGLNASVCLLNVTDNLNNVTAYDQVRHLSNWCRTSCCVFVSHLRRAALLDCCHCILHNRSMAQLAACQGSCL